MIREDRELLAELGRLNSDVVPLAMKIMDESVTVPVQEQCAFAERLITMGRRLQARAARPGLVVEGEIEDSLNGDTSDTVSCTGSGEPLALNPDVSIFPAASLAWLSRST